MRIAYFDCFAGISGDMCLGALADAGADIAEIESVLKGLPVKGYRLASKKVTRSGISATKADVILKKSEIRNHKSEVRKWKDIQKLIKSSSLDNGIKQKGLFIFKALFEAEARVHGEPVEDVHLHELGGTDCLVDIFGTLIGLDMLGVRKIYASAINLGSGTVRTEHGILPVPAPATAELLKGHPVYSSGVPFELTTPTGAALITGSQAVFSAVPRMKTERIGYGAGNKELDGLPNTLRILIGEETGNTLDQGPENGVMIIETNIDDMNPQIYEDVIDKLFDTGALDVFLENIIMKKSRPAVKLTVIAGEPSVEKLSTILFRETTTIGLRFYRAQRKVLDREIRRIKTKLGDVRVKISRLDGAATAIAPEYNDLKALSKKTGLPIKKITEEIMPEIKRNIPG
ncbi:MAG: nickel pincer cofactor biosynthesis protein LarC [Nitrospirae bacterium]|nr:nickel pincer cofactor biosynthesis protein LarC [Nitrospirota bacterium]